MPPGWLVTARIALRPSTMATSDAAPTAYSEFTRIDQAKRPLSDRDEATGSRAHPPTAARRASCPAGRCQFLARTKEETTMTTIASRLARTRSAASLRTAYG